MKTLQNTNNAIVLFDGHCNLCSKSVQFIIKRDKQDYFRFASLQSTFAQSQLSGLKVNADSIVLIENNTIYLASDAALRIARKLSGFYKFLYIGIIIPKFIRDFIYRFIANNRYKWMGKNNECWMPDTKWTNKFLA